MPSQIAIGIIQGNGGRVTATDQSQLTITGNIAFGIVGFPSIGQSFLPTKSAHAGVVLKRNTGLGTYTGDVTVSIQTNSGTSPSGTVLATQTISNATWMALTSGVTEITISLPCTLTIDGSTKYWYVITADTPNTTDYPGVSGSSGNPYASGVQKRYIGGSWLDEDTGLDIYFKNLYFT